MKFRRLVGRADYLQRHFATIAPHLTPLKLANMALNLAELRYGVAACRSLPPYVKIEPAQLCQLRCPGCPHSDALYKRQVRDTTFLTLENFKQIVDPVASTLIGISLSWRGEPMLNKDIASLIAYAHTRNIGISFPTNFSMPLNQERIEALAQSHLDALYVSLDGVSPETYSQYRVGGNFNAVLDNVRRLAEARDRAGRRRPKIVWKFVAFDHNRHELQQVAACYRDLGFDSFEIVLDRNSRSVVDSRKAQNRHLLENRKPCYWLWHTMVIGWDGQIAPCCKNLNFGLGNALRESTRDIWRSEGYRALRAGFSRDAYGEGMHAHCRECVGLEETGSVGSIPLTIAQG